MFKPKNKVKEKDGTSTDTKPSKPKKVKIHDIWEACEHGSAEAMEKLLKKKNGSAQISLVNQDGRSPIHIAASAGHVALVQLLLDNGAQCNMIENTEQRWNVLQHAVNSRNFAMMKLIAEQPTLKPDFRGPSPGTSRMDRNSALHQFARLFETDPEDVIKLIVERGGNVNAVNSQGETPLHIACTYKHTAVAKLLLTHGANANAQNDHGETPLHLGARYGPEEMVKTLLKSGGSTAVIGAHGLPLDVATSVAIRKLLTPPAASSSSAAPGEVSTKKSRRSVNGLTSEEQPPKSTTPPIARDASTARTHTHEPPAPLLRVASKKYHWTVDYAEIGIGPQIGSGGFGIVYKGTWRGIDVAVKCLKGEVLEDELSVFLHEVNVMSRLRHQNILLFVGACLEGPQVCFLTEYIPHGNLRKVLDVERLPPLKKLNMAIEATRGLAYLHSQTPAVLHRDLKSANVLVDDNYHIKLADFGLSRAATLHATDSKSASLADLWQRRSTGMLAASTSSVKDGLEPQNNTSPVFSSAPGAVDASSAPNGDSNANTTSAAAPTTNGSSKTRGKQDATDASLTPAGSEGGSSSEEARNTNTSSASAPVAASTSSTSVDILEQAGTLYTTAPEVLTGAEYTKEADIYALGIIFWELATEKIPFAGLDPLQMLFEIVERSLPVPTEMGTQFGALINDMLSKDPAARPNLAQIQDRLKGSRAQLGEHR